MPFPYIEAAGSAYEMGLQHGRQAARQAAALVEYLVAASGRTRADLLDAVLRFQPRFERYCPGLMEEVRGVARGAGLTFPEALLLQVRGEAAALLDAGGCTAFALEGRHAAAGGILIGQNSDMAAEMEEFFVVLRLQPRDGPAVLMWTLAGQIGYHGVNAAGLAHFANNVAGGPAPPAGGGGLPHYPVKRLLYSCRTREQALAVWAGHPVCSSGNYVMAAGDPAVFDLEVTPEGVAPVEEPGDGILVHANHFLAPRFRCAQTDGAALPDSFARQERMAELLRAGAGTLTVEDVKRALSDHAGSPRSICRHETGGAPGMSTVAGLIAEPGAGRLHVARGHPCRGDWTCYPMQASRIPSGT